MASGAPESAVFLYQWAVRPAEAELADINIMVARQATFPTDMSTGTLINEREKKRKKKSCALSKLAS